MHIAPGIKVTVTAPVGGTTKDLPFVYGKLLVIPVATSTAGQEVTAYTQGLFAGPLKAGETPAFAGEYAYFDGEFFTTTAPPTGITEPVGVFVDNAILVTGQLLA